MMKLYEYQKELLESKEKEVVINWCKYAGKDRAVAVYILENKPNKVAYFGYDVPCIKSELENLTYEYNFSIEDLNKEDFKLIFKSTGEEIFFETVSENTLTGKRVNLLIDDCSSREINLNNIQYDKYIKLLTKNVNNILTTNALKHITVDYKRALKSEAISFDLVIDYLLNGKIDSFYREMALLDKPQEYQMSFTTFAQQALQKLQKQFLDIPSTNDTVLTRKNLIEMIKDIVELHIKLK